MSQNSHLPELSPYFIAEALHLVRTYPPSNPIQIFSRITSDSRKVIPGSLFVALPGERVDGHDYIPGAIASGARGILHRRDFKMPEDADIYSFPVKDTVEAYRKIAGAWRHLFYIPIILVAGSAGKTTTKELLAAILSGRWPSILKTEKSQNGFIGIPMTLLELRPEHQAAVIEVGIDEIGAMAQHLALVNPTISVLTAIGPEHLEKLQDLPTVAQEEGLALSYVAKKGGIVAINMDDPWIRPHFTSLHEGRRIPFSLEGLSTPIDMIQGTSTGKELAFEGLGIQKTTVPLPLLGKHNASNLLAAISIAAGLGLSDEEIQAGLKTFQGAEGRSDIRELPGQILVLCDYYNAQPASVRAGLDLLSELSQERSRTRWACLGDMLELGPNEENYHREIAAQITDLQLEHILLFGPRMKFLSDELASRNYPGRVTHFNSQVELGNALSQSVAPGDTVLIKGSRGMKMEEVWKTLSSCASGNPSHEGKNTPPHS